MASVLRIASDPALHWRPLRAGDLAYVAALEAQIHAAPWTLANFRDAMNVGYLTCVGERESRIVVYGVLMPGTFEAQILNVSVVPDARRQGLGRALLRRFIADSRHLGAEQAFLEVRISNSPAIALYRSEAFAPIARRIAYYPGATATAAREDALVMRLALATSEVEVDGNAR